MNAHLTRYMLQGIIRKGYSLEAVKNYTGIHMKTLHRILVAKVHLKILSECNLENLFYYCNRAQGNDHSKNKVN